MKHFIGRVLRRVRRLLAPPSVRHLEERITALERELDEYRRDSLRVAELVDLVETHLTPGANIDGTDRRH